MAADGSSLVTNAVLRKPPGIISSTTILSADNSERWTPPLQIGAKSVTLQSIQPLQVLMRKNRPRYIKRRLHFNG